MKGIHHCHNADAGTDGKIPGDDRLLDQFAKINIWRRGDERAPHKPSISEEKLRPPGGIVG
jgi:hypothetical protein